MAHPSSRFRSLCFFLLLMLLVTALPARAFLAAAGNLGAAVENGSPGFTWDATLYYKVDQQVLFGFQYGRQELDRAFRTHMGAAGLVRLPLGRIILPIATGFLGSTVTGPNPGFLWKLGGGLDWKNGSHSSILLTGGYEGFRSVRAWYLRGGLLIEI